jgi:hypothetical protein
VDGSDLMDMARRGAWDELELASRAWLGKKRFFLPHLYLITCLIRSGRLAEADREFEDLLSYKFNIEDHLKAFPGVAGRYSERLKRHYVINTMRMESSLRKLEGESRFVRWSIETLISNFPEYRGAAAEIMDAALPPVTPTDRASASICTFGSCFAANLARYMNMQGVNATNLLIEEAINSTYANKALLEAALGKGEAPIHEVMRAQFGEELFQAVREKLAAATHIVLTVGVAPCFFDATTGDFVFAKNYVKLVKSGEIVMRTTTFAENVANLEAIVGLINEIAPAAIKVLTVSPVPLIATAEMRSAVLADCVSKSTLRAAVHELTSADRSLIYFPAFEIFRWLSSHAKVQAFGDEVGDARHVAEWLVEFVVSSFIARFFTAAE